MALFAINEMTTFRWSFEEDVQQYKNAGANAIGVWRQKLSDFGDERGAELLQESGLSVSSLSWAGGFTGSEGKSHQESIEDALEAIQLANTLEAQCLVVYTGPRGGHTHNHARRLAKSALERILPFAEELQVTLALEPMHPGCASEWTFLNDLDEALELVGALASPALRLVFDTYHLCHTPEIVNRLSEVAQHVALVQLGDARHQPAGETSRCQLGDGNLPIADTVSGLKEAGYQGPYELELMGEELEQTDYLQLITNAHDKAKQWI